MTLFAFLLEGKTYQEISDTLFVSQGTARSHASRVYSKLGVHSSQELLDLVRSTSPEGRRPA